MLWDAALLRVCLPERNLLMRSRSLPMHFLAILGCWFMAKPVPAHGQSAGPPVMQQEVIYPQETVTTVPAFAGDKISSEPTFSSAGCKRCHRLRNKMANHPCKCWSHHNYMGCGSFRSECRFIFGSCRQFFNEPCLKGPPSLASPFDWR